mgnify:CR=1 FL=1
MILSCGDALIDFVPARLSDGRDALRPVVGGSCLNVAVGDPLFVVRIDADRRQVIVGPREALLTAALTLKETNWLGGQDDLEAAAQDGQPVLARVRSTREPVAGRLTLLDGEVAVAFDGAEEGVAPGQACVLYDPADPERVLGGGFIARAVRAMDLTPA